jgi:sensor c-di-GMP phosphodiesterase-like protein
MLVAYGCDSAQGYLFSRPCTAEELTAWLITSPYGSPPSGMTVGIAAPASS